jgi:pimeloyl-ACP methyl ester carboxylesterase
MVAFLVLLGTAVFATGAVADGTHGQQAPRMHFGGRVAITTVCFSVTNPAGGQSTLYGLRYIDRGARVDSSTPAIVLAHGIASSTENWDFSPTWSVARGLAAAGYVVYSYDRLGYAKSSYFSQPGGGTTLTTAAHQAELHQLVEEVQTGAFTTTTGGDCSAPERPNRIRNRRVVIIGHSAGGWVVAGYPGQYHDVAATIQADIPASSATLLGQSSGGGFTPDPEHPDYFQFFQTTQNCLDFNTYPPGVVQYVVNIACAPPFLDSPFGEITDLAVMYAQNDAYISMIGLRSRCCSPRARRTRPIPRLRPTPTTPTTSSTAAAM